MSMSDGSVCLLEPLGLLSIRGPDSRRFLQGQLSNNVDELAGTAALPADAAERTLLRAGLHNPQGRTLAVLGLLAAGPDQVLAVLPRELVGITRATLQRYVLRSKVALTDESDTHRLYGLTRPAATPGALSVRYAGARHLLVLSADQAAPLGEALPYEAWHAADVAAGLPQIYAASSGQFIAQMLNLDCIGAVSFTKGCYTGQEVIARAHYRGRVKRRMQRFISREPLQLSPGESGEFSAGGTFRVVDSVQHADGRCEFLAVTTLPGAAAETGTSTDTSTERAPASSDAAEAPAPAGQRVTASALPLPYPLPD
ncbi:MAG TPA: hypothetical protein VHY19_05710 [Steroidobacteraceae bacterium]|jgi:hypothetical protein|nr:hypothetical protein [Steroidobacteraceae bacterium]